jgi:acyl-coenzyme A synthetase/AMP-(fatty) acid ligase
VLEGTDVHHHVRELEKIISLMEGVSDVVVISVDQPSGEQVLKAFVEPEDDTDLNAQSIINQCISKSNCQRAPVSVTVCKIPRTPSGKVQRQMLLEQCAG